MIELNPDGSMFTNDPAGSHDDTIQRMVAEYCNEWKKCPLKQMGLPLAKVLRDCATEIEKELS
jgi:hypothetical protein